MISPIRRLARRDFRRDAALIGAVLVFSALVLPVPCGAAPKRTDVGWRAGAGVGVGLLLPRSCERCPSSAARGIAFGVEGSAPLARAWHLTLAGDARLLGYGGGSTGTLNDLSLSLQHWPTIASLSGGLWVRAGVAWSQLSTSLGDAIDPMGGQSKQFHRVGPAVVAGVGYELPHDGPWTFEFTVKALAAFLSDASAFSLAAGFGVVWH